MLWLQTFRDFLKGYSTIEAAFDYPDQEGRFFFFISNKRLENGQKDIMLNSLALETKKIKDYKWILSEKEHENVGLYKTVYKWYSGEDIDDKEEGYEKFWAKQPLKLEGIEQCCYLKEDWYKGHDSYFFLRKDRDVEEAFITKEQFSLIDYSMKYISQKTEDKELKRNLEGAWPWICSMPFRETLEKDYLHGRLNRWDIYKNFEGIFSDESAVIQKSKKLAELMSR
jgi:hypothetical protein